MTYFLWCITLCINRAEAQTAADTFAVARQSILDGRPEIAEKLMASYIKSHPAEKHSTRLIGQIMSLRGRKKEACALFDKFLSAAGWDSDVSMDKARMMFSEGKTDQTSKTLKEILKHDPKHPEANITMGTIEYWKGNLITATGYAENVLAVYPDNKDALKLKEQISEGRIPVTESNILYESDSQPLQQIRCRTEHTWTPADRHRASFHADLRQYNLNGFDSRVAILTAGDTWQSNYKKWQLQGRAGVAVKQNDSKPDIVASLGVNYQPVRDLYLGISGGREPYLYTVESNAGNLLLQDYGKVALSYENFNTFSGRIEAERRWYPDKNHTSHLSAWVVSPPFPSQKVQLRVGYAFAYNTSKTNTFINVKSVQEVIDMYNGQVFYDGIYDPYYTPDGQMIHSVVSSLNTSLNSRWTVNIRGMYGVRAELNNPYFFLDGTAGSLFVNRQFQVANYHPWDSNLELSYNASSRLLLTLRGSYYQSFYYDDTNVDLTFRYKWLK